ncbi:DUF1223 domain-containing protein [Telluria aromaticivorans]|uniref:DUF1223 domain-containing protein n=1 Tax=Telluria aromaticivorans TaxID=2725995 RepID=A0A7Y2K1Q6_9BURK|nr:DUF1223 domain-containing protein [Telluria aromaticivorans]NNG24743.1 DUF1223 domain-containing protein [Telluria aromaticivorans]
MKPIAVAISGFAFCLATPSFGQNSCRAESGPGTAALVELYTSEGCSSCPPADRELSQLRGKAGRNAVIIPLALHVTYWDRIGWKDGFAQKEFDLRQKLLASHGKSRLVYTPQFFMNGRELRNWRGQFPDAIRKTNQKPAEASVALTWTRAAGDTVQLEAVATGRDPQARQVLYLAVSESRLVSKVLRGENGGATLMHDDTVRAWFPPVRLSRGRAQLHQAMRIPGNWNLQNLQAVAFVQDLDDGIVQQAVSIGQCDPSRS